MVELDILRGFLLLWMTLTHLPTKANLISNQTFGFVSGAEGFIFLAGFMVGQLEYRREKKGGEIATIRDLAKRTGKIYLYHCGLLLLTFTVFAWVAVTYHRPAILNLLSFYLHSPAHAAVAALLLQYRPSLLDILPMYVVFMVITPLARRVAHGFGWDPVIYTSLGIWVAAQFGLRHFVYTHFAWFGIHVPENSTGAFDLYGWQLLWILALAIGTLYADAPDPQPTAEQSGSPLAIPRWLLGLSMAVAATFLVLRYSPVDNVIDADVSNWLIDKWHLGPARMINFAALAIVLAKFGSRIARLKPFAPLALLGQASLEVFSVHVICCFTGDALSSDPDPQLDWLTQIILLVATISALFITAIVSRYRTARKRERLQHPPVTAVAVPTRQEH